MSNTEEPFYRSTSTIRSISVMYDVSIEEHFYRLRSTIRIISGLCYMALLLGSTFTG